MEIEKLFYVVCESVSLIHKIKKICYSVIRFLLYVYQITDRISDIKLNTNIKEKQYFQN